MSVLHVGILKGFPPDSHKIQLLRSSKRDCTFLTSSGSAIVSVNVSRIARLRNGETPVEKIQPGDQVRLLPKMECKSLANAFGQQMQRLTSAIHKTGYQYM
jgi:hypothetical protein